MITMGIINQNVSKDEIDQAVRNGGFYGDDGIWNSLVRFPGDNKLYRDKVETIIVKDRKYAYVKRKPDGTYYLPGGSVEKNLPRADQAVNECREEAHLDVNNIQSTGIVYKTNLGTSPRLQDICRIHWHGTINEIYVADYKGIYRGKIDPEDESPFIRSGKFYPVKECFKFFNKEHRDALLWYLKNIDPGYEVVKESYIGNYFKNRKLLKYISKNPEVERETIEQAIEMLKKEYSRLSTTSNIQRERKREDVDNILHSVLEFEFDDGQTVSIMICFDDKELSDGVAIYNKDIGYAVVVYPRFFKTSKENQVFTLLHEFGHIRLLHLKQHNGKFDFFGRDGNMEYRRKMMTRGKAMYPEVNADLYAILNGAAMYSILGSSFNYDVKGDYDFRFTNAELADRYQNVFKKYGRLRGFSESKRFSNYDIANLAIYESIYEDEDLKLTEEEKDDLYTIVYEYFINRRIGKDPIVQKKKNEYNHIKGVYEETYRDYKDIVSNTIISPDVETEELILSEKVSEDEVPLEHKELKMVREKMDQIYNDYMDEQIIVFENMMEIPGEEKLSSYPEMKQLGVKKKYLKEKVKEVIERVDEKLMKNEPSKERNYFHHLFTSYLKSDK